MNRLLVPLLFAALCLPALSVIGETYETEEAWNANVEGELIPLTFGSLEGPAYSIRRPPRLVEVDEDYLLAFKPYIDDPSEIIFSSYDGELSGFAMPQTLAWGELAADNDNFLKIDRLTSLIGGFDIISDPVVFGQDIELRLAPSLGRLSGVSFYVNPTDLFGIPTGSEVRFFDGENLVDTLTYSHGDETDQQTTFDSLASYVGWTNSNGVNVTRIVISFAKEELNVPPPGSVGDDEDVLLISYFAGLISEGELAFSDSTPLSPQELLNDILVNVGSIPSTGSNRDDRRINRAIDQLNAATNPIFWEDEDTLSYLGSAFFQRIYNAQQALLRVRTPSAEVEQAIEDLDFLLQEIVKTEIAEATAAGGGQGLLNAAQFHQNLADLDAAAGNYATATARRYWAWFYARIS